MKQSRRFHLLVLLAAVFVSNAHAERPAPKIYQYDEWNLASLQRKYSKAVADPVPWSGFWWPYSENGIANREFDRSGLSPAGKLDIALGYGYWIEGWENDNHGASRGAAEWWGHCNGWATAAIMEPEPRKHTTVNGVRFDVRDRKALLSEYWLESGADYIGTRVWDPNDTSSAAFWDVVPAQFYLVMTNIVGRQRRSVIVDRHTGAEVWNQPVVAYQMDPITPDDYLGPDPDYPNIYRVNMSATLWWANDQVDPDEVTPRFDWRENMFFNKRRLRFELWVDAPLEFDRRGRLERSGDIILTNEGVGGRWKNGMSYEVLINSHPDFIWIPLSYAGSSGYKNPRLNDAWVNSNLSERNK